MKKSVFLLLFFITACSSGNQALYKNEYGNGIFSATGDTLGECYQKAYEQCESGFEKMDRIVNPKADKPVELVYECK